MATMVTTAVETLSTVDVSPEPVQQNAYAVDPNQAELADPPQIQMTPLQEFGVRNRVPDPRAARVAIANNNNNPSPDGAPQQVEATAAGTQAEAEGNTSD